MTASSTSSHSEQEATSRQRLLVATERLLLNEGAHSLSLRRIAAEAKLNTALVSYYFGNLEGLLREISALNLGAMVETRRQWLARAAAEADPEQRLTLVLEAYALPLWQTTTLCALPSASVIVEELLGWAGSELRAEMISTINASVEETVKAMRPLVPHLSDVTLIQRLRMLAGAVVFARPRAYAEALFAIRGAGRETTLDEILQLMRGALLIAEA
ncbi:MAG: helix-turn-helix domain-containing protein [Spongiibacteraceae bacterium]|nr:helix-turn-helix domain-containing protein [Spongiibacteraceae bacterium]